MTTQVTKRLGGYSCCHRQWKADSHCRFLHGYDRFVEITWEGDRDDLGWVVDFGGLGALKRDLDHQFDHTTLIAPSDPHLEHFEALHHAGVLDLRVMDPTMEGMTLWVANLAHLWTSTNVGNRVAVVEVACWENDKNCARWTA